MYLDFKPFTQKKVKRGIQKFPKSIPEALEKVTIINVISKEYFDITQYRLRDWEN